MHSKIRSVLIPLLLLGSGAVQAFSVTINSLERTLSAVSSTGDFIAIDELTYGATGEWAGTASYYDEASASFTTSNVPDPGSYGLYELTMAGSLFATSYSSPVSAFAGIDLNVTFDEDVNLVLTCPQGSGFSQVKFNPQPFVNLYCGESLALTAGTYDFSMFSSLGILGGTVSTDFDATLTVTAVPIPAAVWLFGSALAGLGWMRRKQAV